MEFKNEYGTFSTQVIPDDINWGVTFDGHLAPPKPPISNVYIGDSPYGYVIGVDKKFN